MPQDPVITVLHLSDVQFGKQHLFGGNGLTAADQAHDTLFSRLHDDLRLLAASPRLKPDLVVVTGDLAEWGRKSEFDQVEHFLDELRGALSLAPHRIAVVPGNHDINRDACSAYFQQCTADENEPAKPYWPKWQHFLNMFSSFYRDVPQISFDVGQEWTLFEMPDLRVVVAGLNSTMAESHLDTDHFGWVGEEQCRWFAEQLVDYERRGWLRIGAVHHNLLRGAELDDENLRDAATIDTILGQHLNLILHGHTHAAGKGFLTSGLPVLSTGSAAVNAAARPTEVPNQYQIVQIRPDGITRWARHYVQGQKRWVADTRISDDGSAWRDDIQVSSQSVAGTFPADADRGHRQHKAAPIEAGLKEREQQVRDRATGEMEGGALINRVAEICRLRHRGARVKPVYSEPAYLRVTTRESAFMRQWAVGVQLDVVTGDDLARFVERVHHGFRATDPHVLSDLVHGGGRAPEPIIRAARKQGVRLWTFPEYQGLLDLSAYVRRQTAELARDASYPPDLYVDQRFRVVAGPPARQANLMTETVDWLVSDQARFLLLLGDFGRGKTFFMHELARQLPSEVPHLVPMLIDLRTLEKTRSVDQLVAQHLAAAGEERIDLAAFRYMLRQGRIALLFDGFDELALRVTYDRAAEHLQTIVQAAEGSAKVVVSSRSQHFVSMEQVRTALGSRVDVLPGRRIVELEDFERPQMHAFLSKRFGGDERLAADRLALIEDVRDLLGLSRNPRMLGFIATLDEARLREVQSRTGSISSADLYRELIESWLRHEVQRQDLGYDPVGSEPSDAPGRVSRLRLHDALTALALRLWNTTERSVGLAELGEVAGSSLTDIAGGQLSPDQATHAVGSGTLLVRTDDGRFGFIHQSVMEWLVADEAAKQLVAGDTPETLGARDMTPLMADFLCGLAGSAVTATWAGTVLATRTASEAAKSNALVVQGRLGAAPSKVVDLTAQDLRGADLSGRDLRGADLTGADLTNSRLVGADLTGARLPGACLAGARLDRATLVNAQLSGADVTRAALLGADLTGAVLTDVHWSRAALVGATVDLGALRSADPTAVPVRQPQLCLAPTGAATSVAFTTGLLAVGSSDGSVCLRDPVTGDALRTLTGHQGGVYAVAFSPDGARLASAGNVGTVRLWDAATGDPLRTLTGHQGGVYAVAFSPDGALLASAGNDRTIRLWDAATGDPLRILTGHQGGVNAVAFSPDGARLASAGDDGTIQLWDPATGEPLRTLTGHQDWVRTVAFSPGGTRLASAGDDGTIRLWDPATGDPLRTLTGHQGGVNAMAFSPDGARLASAGNDRTIQLWDPATGDPLRTLTGHQGWVNAVAFSPDGALLASAGNDRTIRLWDPATGDPLRTLTGHQRGVNAMAFSPGGTRLASAGNDGTVQLWDPTTGDPLRTLTGHQRGVYAVAFRPDGALLASAGNDRTIQLWDPATGDPLRTLTGHQDWVRTVAFSPDGTRLASASDDGTVQLWDPAIGDPLRTLTGHQDWVRTVAFSPDSARLASAGNDGTVRLWDAATGDPLRTLTGHQRGVNAVAFSPDGTRLASAGNDGTVQLWDPATGDPLRTLTGHQRWANAVAFSPGGTRLASAGSDGSIRLWDPTTGDPLRTLTGHQGGVNAVAFSPDGARLASAGSDGTVRLWDPATGDALGIMLVLADGWAVLASDGRYKMLGDSAGAFWYSVALCRFEPGELDDYAPSIRRVSAGTEMW